MGVSDLLSRPIMIRLPENNIVISRVAKPLTACPDSLDKTASVPSIIAMMSVTSPSRGTIINGNELKAVTVWIA